MECHRWDATSPPISSSENNSPCETTSPMLILSPKSNPYSRFNYPGTSKKKPLVGGNLLDPLPVPFPSFGSEAEYMVLTPSIHPRSPPAPQPGMDLKPQVEIYQVNLPAGYPVSLQRLLVSKKRQAFMHCTQFSIQNPHQKCTHALLFGASYLLYIRTL